MISVLDICENDKKQIKQSEDNLAKLVVSRWKEINQEKYATYSDTARLVHNALQVNMLMSTTHLDYPSGLLTTFYKSKSSCKDARNKALKNAYTKASNMFAPYSHSSIAYDTANIYGKHLKTVILPMIDDLEDHAKKNNKMTFWEMTKPLIMEASDNLLKKYNKDLSDNENYYKMYNYSFFEGLTDIETHDYRINETGVLKALETLFEENVEYTIVGFDKALQELNDDLELRSATFYRKAWHIYQEYIQEIVQNIDVLTKEEVVVE